jgi:hypothetical protein
MHNVYIFPILHEWSEPSKYVLRSGSVKLESSFLLEFQISWDQSCKTFFVRNLRIFEISLSVCRKQACPALSNDCG